MLKVLLLLFISFKSYRLQKSTLEKLLKLKNMVVLFKNSIDFFTDLNGF